MKHILAPIILLTLLFPSHSYGEEMHELVKRDGLYYKKFTEVPFTGQVWGQSQGSVKNGKADGPWVSYQDKRLQLLKYKGTYKNGKKVGPWIGWHDDGQLWEKDPLRTLRETILGSIIKTLV